MRRRRPIEREKPPVGCTTGGLTNSLEAFDRRSIAHPANQDKARCTFHSSEGGVWSYHGKRARVLFLLVTSPNGLTQWDTLPWHTRLGGTIHAMRRDGLSISTEIEGRYRHARYRLVTRGRFRGPDGESEVAA